MSFGLRLISWSTLLVLCLTIVFGAISSVALAQPTYTINYQGKLTTPAGLAVTDGTYNMRFWLLQSTGQATTSAVWTESRTGGNKVTVENGLFSVQLGSVTSLSSVNFNQALYLGVEIGGSAGAVWDGEMLPRKIVGTVPSAFESKQLGGVASTSFLRSDAADSASSLLTFTGGLISNSSSTLARLNFTNATGTSLFIGGDRITDFSGTNLSVIGNALGLSASYLGQTSITTLGTISAGTWQGTAINATYLDSSVILASELDTSAKLAALLGDETGSAGGGLAVFSISPTLTTPNLGTPSAITLTSGTGLPISTGLTGAGTGVLTALGVNVGTAGAFVVNGGVLGTPSSGTLTNATGLPIVGGTTGTLTETRGGTNQTTYTTGDIIYASAANTLSKRAIGTTGQVMQVVGGLPTWVATSSLGISGGGGSFLSLTDTFDAYTAYRIPFTNSGANALIDDAGFFFNGTTDTLTVGTATFSSNLITFAGAATTTVPNNNAYAFTIATSTTARPLFRIDTTTGGESVSIGTVGGDVYIGGVGSPSNLVFEESSTISGQGTNLITLGVSGDRFNVVSGAKFGIATTTPWQEFSVNGDIALTGRIYDSLASAGTSGMVLQTTGTGTRWVATSSLGLSVSEATVEAYIFDGDNAGTLSSGILALDSLSYSGTVDDLYVNDAITVAGGILGSNTISAASTWATAGTLTIGDGGDRIDISSNTWDVTNGVFTDATSYNGLVITANTGVVTTGTWQAGVISSTYLDTATILSTEIDTSSELDIIVTDNTGSGALVFGTNPTLTGNTISYASLTASRALFLGSASQATTTALSASLLNSLTDETGTGVAVFSISPILTTPNLGTPTTLTLTSATGLPIPTGLTGAGTGVLTALGVNVGTAGAFVTFNGALGTPSSGTVTNLTGTASININGTVGATTPSTGVFTTATTTNLVVNGERFTDLTGTGLAFSGNTLTASLGIDITAAEIANGDHGFFSYASGVASLDTGGLTSANLTTALTDETGSGAAVFGTNPTLTGNTISYASLTASRALFLGSASQATTTALSASLLNSLTDETGTGVAVFDTAPTFTTSITASLVYGGTGAASGLTVQSTSGAGTSDFIKFLVGNAGAVEAARFTTAGRLGLGTTTPNQRLSIFANGADAAIEFSTITGTPEKWTVGIDDSDGAKFKISSSSVLGTNDRLTIDGNGRVGIGTTIPTNILETYTIDAAGPRFTAGNSAQSIKDVIVLQAQHSATSGGIGLGARIIMNIENSANSYRGAGGIATVWTDPTNTTESADLYFETRLSGTLAEKMRLRGNGNLGIGTTTPNQALSIFRNGADAALELSTISGAAEKWTIGIDDSDSAKFKISSSSALGTSDRFVINGSGFVGIGDSTPTALLTVGSGDLFTVNSFGVISSSNNLTPNSILSSGQVDEYCLTYEGTGTTFEWQICASGFLASTDIDTSSELDTIVTDNTGSGALVFGTSPTFTTSANFGTAGVRLSDDGDGGLTFLGLGNGNDEDLKLDLDNTANAGVFTSSTGLTQLTFTGIGINTTAASGYAMFGTKYLYASTTNDSISLGEDAGRLLNGNGLYNVAIGFQAGYSATSSDNNTFVGTFSGYTNSSGSDNTFLGYYTGVSNTSGAGNVMIGSDAGRTNSIGGSNTFVGNSAAYSNLTGSGNAYFGSIAGQNGVSGSQNSFFGRAAGLNNRTGSYNAFVGYQAGNLINATSSVAVGAQALYGGAGTVGVGGTVALGYQAGYAVQNNANNNIFVGYRAADNLTTGTNNIIIGYDVDAISATASNRLNIGNLIFGTGLDGTGTTLSSGNIGIGTTTPNQALSIFKNAADSAIEFSTVSGANEKWTIGIDDSDAAKFKISSSSALGTNDRFVIDGGGRMGINKSSPTAMLDVVIGSASYTGLQVKAAASQSGAFFNMLDSNNVAKAYFDNLGNFGLASIPATAVVSAGSPYMGFNSAYWNGSASVSEPFYMSNERYGGGSGSAGAYRFAIGSQSNPDLRAFSIAGDGSNATGINNPYISSATDAQFIVTNGSATRKGLVVQAAASQSDSLIELQNSGGTSLFTVNSSGVVSTSDNLTPNAIFSTGQADEECLTYEATGTTFEWQSCGSGFLASIDIDTSSELDAIVTDNTGSGALVFGTSPTLTTSANFGSAGVRLSDDGDGGLTFLGLGNGNDEDLKLDLDNTANTGVFTSSTGLTQLTFSGIGINTTAATGYSMFGTKYLYASTTNDSISLGESAGRLYNGGALGNVAVGFQAGYSATSSDYNSFLGYQAGFGGTSSSNNVAIGYQALYTATSSSDNIAIGRSALRSLNGSGATGSGLVAVGYDALYSNTSGTLSVALGHSAFRSNTIGNRNIGIGYGAGYWSTTGSDNVFVGQESGVGVTGLSTGFNNVAIGTNAFSAFTTASYNSVLGRSALGNNKTGNYNTAFGYLASTYNAAATTTVAIGAYSSYGAGVAYANQGGTTVGYQSGYSFQTGSHYNTLIGYFAGYNITTGQYNTYLGSFGNTGGVTTGSNNVLIGQDVRSGLTVTASNQLNIGNLLYGTGLSSGTTLSTGKVGIGTSTPNQKLGIFASAADSAIEFSTVSGSAEKWTIGIDDSDAAKFKISSSSALGTNDRFVIDGNGNVGLGTSNPTSGYKLDVSGNLIFSATSAEIRLNSGGSWLSGGSNTMYFGSGSTAGSGNAAMTLTATGLGIGDITPAAALTVGNGDLFQVNSSGAIAASTAITTTGNLTLSGSAANIVLGSNYLSGDGGDEGIAIDSAGTMTITQAAANSVAANFSDGTSALFVVPNLGAGGNNPISVAGDIGLIFRGSGSSDTATGIVLAPWDTQEMGLRMYTDGGASMTTTIMGGNVGIGDNSPSALLSVGNGDLFQVNSSGAIAASTAITSSGNFTLSGSAANILLGSNYLSGDGGDEGISVDSLGNVGALQDQFSVCSGGACASTANGDGTITAERAITSEEGSLTAGATITVNWDDGNQQYLSLTSNSTTTAFSNNTTGQTLRLVACQDATGGRTFRFSPTIKWSGGTTPTQTSTANKCDVYSFIQTTAGTFGSFNQNF